MYHYLEYLPLYLREIEEFEALGTAADPPAREVYEYTIQQYRNQFILQADDKVLTRWEKIFHLSNPGLDIAFRRQRIISKFCLRAPVTVKRLEELTQTITGAPCKIALDFPLYHMQVQVFDNDFSFINYPFLYAELYELKPANMTMELNRVAETPPMPTGIFLAGVLGRGYTVTRLPEIGVDFDAQNTQRVTADAQNITQTVLPRLEEEKT